MNILDVTNGRAAIPAGEKNGSNANDLHQRSCLIWSPAIKSPNPSEAEDGDDLLLGNHIDEVTDDQKRPASSLLPPRNLIEKVSRSQLDSSVQNENGMDVVIFLNHPEITHC